MKERLLGWVREAPMGLVVALMLLPGVVLGLCGYYLPGSPVHDERAKAEIAEAQLKPLQADVDRLRIYDRKRVDLRVKLRALRQQIETLQAIVPDDSRPGEFLRMIQDAAATSQVSIRRLTAKPVAEREYHYEMPFEIEADGPYFGMQDFFAKLGRLARIINVGDITLSGLSETAVKRPNGAPGASVSGIFTLTTYYTNPDAASGGKSAAPGQAAGIARPGATK